MKRKKETRPVEDLLEDVLREADRQLRRARAATPAGRPIVPRGPKKTRALRKFDPATGRLIIDYLLTGAWVETAAAAAGVCKQTLYNWLRRGARDGKGPVWEWAQEVHKAKAMAEVSALEGITAAGLAGNWQAFAWRLERGIPDRWAKRDPLNIEQLAALMIAMRSDERRAVEAALKAGVPITPDEARRIARGEQVATPSDAETETTEEPGKPGP